MLYGQTIPIFGWERALIHFVENEGMAFGKTLNIPYGKLILSLFRLVAVGFLIVFIRSLAEMKAQRGLLISFALILAGAIGNILDSAFYGILFSASYSHGLPAEFLPATGGYAPFLHGRVVDMFYFPLFEGNFPDWIPRWGGQHFIFFRPVFNIADVAISWGVLQVLFFHREFFKNNESDQQQDLPTDGQRTESNPLPPPGEEISGSAQQARQLIEEEE